MITIHRPSNTYLKILLKLRFGQIAIGVKIGNRNKINNMRRIRGIS